MAKITLDLNQFKASGVYTLEFDASERIVVSTQTIRLVVGFSRVGPINAPVFLRDVNTCRRIFGQIDTFLEKRGSFFHRAMETCLTVGPIFALNLMPLRSNPVNEGGDSTNYKSFALASDEENGPVTRALVTSFYNKERFWFPDTEYVIATQNSAPINRDYLLTVVNLSQAPLSVIVRKSVNAAQYNVQAKDYYGLGNVPDYMADTDYLSDFFLDLIVVEGDWTNLTLLSQDPTFSKFFDARGIIVSQLDAFLNLDQVTLVGAFTGTIIPNFVDNQGSNQYLENIVNAAVGLTGIFIAINNEKIEDYANSTRKIDTIGNNLIGTSDDTIDFLSYNTPIKNILEYVGEENLSTSPASTDLTIYNVGSSTSNVYVKSYPFGGRSGNWNNVLVIPKPEPGDSIFLPSQYQQILDSTSTNTLIKTYGSDDFTAEKPNDYVKVENVIDTGTELQIQLSSPLNVISSGNNTPDYYPGVIAQGVATLVPNTANEIEVGPLTDVVGSTLTPVAGDFILVEYPGFHKYYEVDSYSAPAITVVSTTLSDDAPYYFNKYGSLGLDIDDYTAVVQPSDITVTLFKGNTSSGTALANTLVPDLGVVLSSTDFGDSITMAFSPTVTVQGYEGIGNSFPNVGDPTADAPASVECGIFDAATGSPIGGPYWIHTLTLGSTPGNRVVSIQLLEDDGNLLNPALTPVTTIVNGYDYIVTMTQSGISFTATGTSNADEIESTDILKYACIEAYPGSKLAKNINNGLVVNGDRVKYNVGASDFNYLGVQKNTSKSAASGSINPYSQIAYGLKGIKINQFSSSSLITGATATFAPLNGTYEDIAPFTFSGANALAIYSSLAKNISSNIEIVGTLSGGGKKFVLSSENSGNVNVGDLIVNNNETPRLTRVTGKVKKVNPSTGVVTYEYTTLDVVALDTQTNTITKYTPIQQFCDRLQFTLLNGYRLTDYHLPNNTDTQIEKIYGVIENTEIGKTLASRDVISFRYIVDTFNGGISPMMGPKSILSRMAKRRQKCMALLNAPSIKQFIASTDPRFTDAPDPQAGNPKPILKTEYIATGGNLDLGPSFRFTLPDEDQGAKFIGVFSPNIIIRENNQNISIPPAADVSNNFIRKFINGQPYAIVAGPRRGVISNPKFAGLEYEYLLQDRENLEPIGINPIVTVKGVGPMIFANQTAYQRTLSAFNNLHVRDLLITVEEAVEDVLKQYLFEFNDASTRLEIRTIVENYLDTVRNAGGIYDYAVIMDDTNNTPVIIDQNFGIIDIAIEPARGLQKFINRITILKTGTISSGGFSAA